MKLTVVDSTLREGRQSIYFQQILDIEIRYLAAVERIGIRDIEYRNPFVSGSEMRAYKKVAARFPKLHFFVHIYLNERNVSLISRDQSIRHISTFLPYPFAKASLAHLDKLSRKKIRVGIENAFSLSHRDLKRIITLLNDRDHVIRIGLSDTLGIATPDSVRRLLKFLIRNGLARKSIEFHFHNDRGLAAANALEVIRVSAKSKNKFSLSSSMYGLGERNGILSFGDLFANLIKSKAKHKLSLKHYSELVKLMDSHKIAFNRDPLGENNFTHFASSHILAQYDAVSSYEANPSAAVGMETTFLFNALTEPPVYARIFEKATGIKTAVGAKIKEYMLSEMKKSGKTYLSGQEIASILKRNKSGFR